MTACSSDITAPPPNVPASPSLSAESSCRTGYLVSTGRCAQEESAEAVTLEPTAASTPTCRTGYLVSTRTGYLVSTGRCQ
jgi:hypothetical protein